MRYRLLVSVSAAASLVYLLAQHWQPFAGSAILKGIPVGALAVVAFASRYRRKDAAILALALAFSTAGDVLLDVAPSLFVAGLAAFLLAHLTYIVLFVRNGRRGAGLNTPVLAAVSGTVAFSITLSLWIVPSVGNLMVPVVLYIAALTTMVCTAILGRFGKGWVAIGAVLFLISDSLLAIHKFKAPVPIRDQLVWITYYLGQCGIALGYLESGS